MSSQNAENQPPDPNCQSRRSSVSYIKEFNYVGRLTLREFHSSITHGERALMLDSDVSNFPYNPASFSHQGVNVQGNDLPGLQVQCGTGYRNPEQLLHHHQQLAPVDPTCLNERSLQGPPSLGQNIVATCDHDEVLESSDDCINLATVPWETMEPSGDCNNNLGTVPWEPMEPSSGDCNNNLGTVPWVSSDTDLLANVAGSHKDSESQIQLQEVPGEPQTFTAESDPRSHFHNLQFETHIGSANVFAIGDLTSTGLREDQFDHDVLDRLQLTQETGPNIGSSSSSELLRIADHPYSALGTTTSVYSNARGYKSFGTTFTSSSSYFGSGGEFHIPIPPHLISQRNLSGVNSNPRPATEGFISHENMHTGRPSGSSMSIRVNFGCQSANAAASISSTGRTTIFQNLEMSSSWENIKVDVGAPSTGLPQEPTAKPHRMEKEKVHEASAAEVRNTNNADGRDKYKSSKRKKESITDALLLDAHSMAKTAQTFVTEKKRRENLNEKFDTLRSLIPESKKHDRASVVEQTVAYVKNLKLEVAHLEKVKHEKMKIRRQKLEAAGYHYGQMFAGCGFVSSQRLKKTSHHGTDLDIHQIQDELLLSIAQKHMPGFLVRMAIAFETELKVEVLNGTGAVIDGHDVYTFKLKINGNSYAVTDQTMTKFLDVLDTVFEDNLHIASWSDTLAALDLDLEEFGQGYPKLNPFDSI